MSTRKLLCLFFMSAILTSLNACSLLPSVFSRKTFNERKINNQPDNKTDNQPKKKLVSPEDDYSKYKKEINTKFNQRQFAWLDEEARKLRIGKVRINGGVWKIRVFYAGIESPLEEGNATDTVWQAHINLLREWRKQNPKSITAHVGLAFSFIDYAWKARGNGYANTVSEEGWKLFSERLTEAESVLYQAMSLPEKCPHLYVGLLLLARETGWDLQSYNQLFSEAVKVEPTYFYYHRMKASYLLPRWHGQPGDWERFADSVVTTVSGDEGKVIFFHIYANMLSMHELDFMQSHTNAWANLLEGFRIIDKKYGASPTTLNQACLMAMTTNHVPIAAELFDRIGEDWDEEVWRSRNNFEGMRFIARKMVEEEKKKSEKRNAVR